MLSNGVAAIAEDWRRDASRHRDSCRLHEEVGDRQRADRHYQRSLDLDACAKRLEDLVLSEKDFEKRLTENETCEILIE